MSWFDTLTGKGPSKKSSEKRGNEQSDQRANPSLGEENSTSQLVGSVATSGLTGAMFPDLSKAAWDTFGEPLFAAGASALGMSEMTEEAPDGGEASHGSQDAAGVEDNRPEPAPTPLPSTVTTGNYEWRVEEGGSRFVSIRPREGIEITAENNPEAFETCGQALAALISEQVPAAPDVPVAPTPQEEDLLEGETDGEGLGLREALASDLNRLDELDKAYNPMRWMRDAAAEAAVAGINTAYQAWLSSPDAVAMAKNRNADAETAPEPTPEEVSGPGTDYLRRLESGAIDQTVSEGVVGDNTTLELAGTRHALGDEATHYERPEVGGTDLKFAQVDGAADQATFWCSGLTLWTLGARGYDLRQGLAGADGVAHQYCDKNGTEEIEPFMLIDGQPEAVHAMGIILEHFGRSKKPWEYNGVIVDYARGKMTYAANPDWENPLVTFREEKSGKDRVVTREESFGNDEFYERNEDGTHINTLEGVDYDDNAAVMGAAGAFELMGIGARVPAVEIMPGDFGQTFKKSTDGYRGVGHGYQIWKVIVRGTAQYGVDGAPVFSSFDEVRGTPEVGAWVTGEFTVAVDTDAATVVREGLTLVRHDVIEANFANNGDLGDGDGGVGVASKRSFTNGDDQREASSDARSYFGRLHESPWSEQNWTTTNPETSAKSPEEPALPEPALPEPEGPAQQSWYARFFGE